jgi:hypothetical protein
VTDVAGVQRPRTQAGGTEHPSPCHRLPLWAVGVSRLTLAPTRSAPRMQSHPRWHPANQKTDRPSPQPPTLPTGPEFCPSSPAAHWDSSPPSQQPGQPSTGADSTTRSFPALPTSTFPLRLSYWWSGPRPFHPTGRPRRWSRQQSAGACASTSQAPSSPPRMATATGKPLSAALDGRFRHCARQRCTHPPAPSAPLCGAKGSRSRTRNGNSGRHGKRSAVGSR